jgi:hypothetical protein
LSIRIAGRGNCGFVDWDWEDIIRRVDLILEAFAKVGKCIKMDIFDMPRLILYLSKFLY